MLEWLGRRHGDDDASAGARRIEAAVAAVLAARRPLTPDVGGEAGTAAVGDAVVARL